MDSGPDHVDDQRSSSETTGDRPWWASINPVPEMGPTQVEIAPPAAPVVLSPSEGPIRGPGELAFEGMAEPGCRLQLVDWAVPVAETVVESSGYWSLRLAAVGVGDHMYAALCVDAEGRQSPTCRPFLLEVRKDAMSKMEDNSGLTPPQPASGAPGSVLLDPDEPVERRENEEPAEIPPAPTMSEILKVPVGDSSGIFNDRAGELDAAGRPLEATASPGEPEPVVGSASVAPTTESLLKALPPLSVSHTTPSPGSEESADGHRLSPTTTARHLPLDSILISAVFVVLAGIALGLFQSRFSRGGPSVASIALNAGLTPPSRDAPAAEKLWHFFSPGKRTRTVVITLYNGGHSRETVLVMTRTRTVWRVLVPPKSEAEAVLSRIFSAKALTIESSAPIVPWRTVLQHHGLVRSYGIAGP